MAAAGVDVAAFHTALGDLNTAAQAMTERVEALNLDYLKAREDGDSAAMEKLWAEGKELTA